MQKLFTGEKNLFRVPYGRVGKDFVFELAKLYHAFANGSALESIALKAASLMPVLLLQKPARRLKTSDLISCLERRLDCWKKGNLEELLWEGRTIQQHIPSTSISHQNNDCLAHTFSNLMFQGKVSAALRLLSEKNKGGVLHLDDSIGPTKVREVLVSKHPQGQQATPDVIIPSEPTDVHPVMFEPLDATMIKSAALQTSGAAGPSGLDAIGWRRLCTSYRSASTDLCQSLALSAKRICTSLIDPLSIAPLLACRLIALDKNPGVRPIGIGEIPRRIIAKAILHITKQDIQEAAGSLHMCWPDFRY